jgi:sulfite exporter TauE/SafE
MTGPGAELGFLAALLAGLAGSGHCLGMCGGISAALAGGGRGPAWLNALLLSTGRIASYALAGAIAGTGGALLGRGLDLLRLGQTLRLGFGLLLVAVGLTLALRWRGLQRIEALGGRVWACLAPALKGLLPPRHPAQALLAGALWGWLPCGLVYSMLTLALASGDPARGALVMTGFGLGTLPAVVGAGSAAAGALRRLRGSAGQRAAGALLAVFGLWTALGALPHGDHAGHDTHTLSTHPADHRH